MSTEIELFSYDKVPSVEVLHNPDFITISIGCSFDYLTKKGPALDVKYWSKLELIGYTLQKVKHSKWSFA